MSQYNLLGQKRYKDFMKFALLRSLLLILIPVILYFWIDLHGILIGMAISYFICSIPFMKMLKFKINSFNKIKSNFHIVLQNFGVDLSSNLSRRIDKLLIAPLLGFASTGIYQFNLQILFGLELIPTALHSFLLSEESSGKKHKKIEFSVIVFSVIISLIVIGISPFLIEYFLPSYSDGIPSLQILVISIIPLTIIAVLNAKLQAKESTKIGFSAILRIGTLLILIMVLGQWLGLMGLSLSVLFSVIAHVVFLFILYRKTKS